MQQKILWAEVQKETKRWKSRWTVRDLLVHGRCGQAVLDFLSSTDVGRLVPPLEEGDAGSEALGAPEASGAGRGAGGGGGGGGAGCRGGIGCRGVAAAVPAHALLRGIDGRGVGDVSRFLLLFPLSPNFFFRDRPRQRVVGELATCRHRADSGREKRTKCAPPYSR